MSWVRTGAGGYIVRCADSFGLKYRTRLRGATRYLPDFSLCQRVYFIEQQGIDAGSGAWLYLDFMSPNSRESGMLLPIRGNLVLKVGAAYFKFGFALR
jgi:hypothetical protein